MIQLATSHRAEEAQRYVREKIAERGWTEEIEMAALHYIYDDNGEPQYPRGMSQHATSNVPVINNWWAPAIVSWSEAMFPKRGGGFFGWGCLGIVLVFAWVAAVFAIYFIGVAVITLCFAFTAAYDLLTYSHRRAVVRQGEA